MLSLNKSIKIPLATVTLLFCYFSLFSITSALASPQNQLTQTKKLTKSKNKNATSLAPVITNYFQNKPLASSNTNLLQKPTLKTRNTQRRIKTSQKTVKFLKGRLSTSVPGVDLHTTVENAWRDLLQKYAARLNLDTNDGSFLLQQLKQDKLKKTHVWYQQAVEGIPIWGKQVVYHLNEKNQGYLFQGDYLPRKKYLTIQEKISLDEALQITQKTLNMDNYQLQQAELNYYPDSENKLQLAYKLEITQGLEQRWLVFVDAVQGVVLHQIQNIHTAGELISATGVNLNGDRVSFNAWFEGDEYFLIDPSLPKSDSLYDPLNGPKSLGDTFIFDAQESDGSEVKFVNNLSPIANWDPAAVSAMQNTLSVYDYYLQTFNRKSIDDKNKNLLAVVHFDESYNNAFWNGSFMVYGDGDGKVFSSLANCLDVAAHEMTHGVIENSANLIYQHQSGALNESFADVFAVLIDRNNWTIGEDCTVASPGYLRSLSNPQSGLSPQPSRMSQYRNLPNTPDGDNGGVHINSGIPNHAAYLTFKNLQENGNSETQSFEKTEQIYYRALNLYLHASSRFLDARRALVQAAEDLYGEAEMLAVQAAWDEVEVYETGEASVEPKLPAQISAVQGKDMMVYVVPDVEWLNLYVQVMDENFNGYDVNQDFGPLNFYLSPTDQQEYLMPLFGTKPAAFTDEQGTIFFFVGEDNNLYAKNGIDAYSEQITSANDIWSIAVSPDARYFAYTLVEGEPIVRIIDLDSGKELEFSIKPTNYQENSKNNTNSILYADSLSFDFSSSKLVFDALNCISTPDDSCELKDGGYRYWSVGILDLVTERVINPLPDQNPSIDLGYPTFASNNNFVLAMDQLLFDENEAVTPFHSKVISLNIETQEQNILWDFGRSEVEFYGIPGFWGDDKFLTTLFPDERVVNSVVNEVSAQRIAIDQNWQATTEGATVLNDFAVFYPFMHRAGQRQQISDLKLSSSQLDFGEMQIGDEKTLSLSITNESQHEIEIVDLVIKDQGFQHNGVNQLLAEDESVMIDISFLANSSETVNSVLQIRTDSAQSLYSVVLLVNRADQNLSNSDETFFGCSLGVNKKPDFILLLLVTIASAVLLFRRCD